MGYREGRYIDEDTLEKIRKGEQLTPENRKDGWSSQSGSRFTRAAVIQAKFDAGAYTFFKNDHGFFFDKKTMVADRVSELPGLPIDYVLNQIKTFWERKDLYKQHGLLHKRGIMLYGGPGCGKTSIINLLCKQIMARDGVIFIIDDFEDAAAFLHEFRTVEPNRPILTIMEDIEGYFDGSAGADQLKAALSFLDGENQVDNVVHIATTNEPEKLADRFIKRPGRFDLIIGIHNPSAETRDAYLKYVDPALDESLRGQIVEKTQGLTLAYLRELISTHVCLGIPLEETLRRLRSDSKHKVLKNSGDQTEKMGFTIGYEGKK